MTFVVLFVATSGSDVKDIKTWWVGIAIPQIINNSISGEEFSNTMTNEILSEYRQQNLENLLVKIFFKQFPMGEILFEKKTKPLKIMLEYVSLINSE